MAEKSAVQITRESRENYQQTLMDGVVRAPASSSPVQPSFEEVVKANEKANEKA